jgi:hypothetical protein
MPKDSADSKNSKNATNSDGTLKKERPRMAAPVRIGDLLISKGMLSKKQLQIALIQQRVTGAILGDTLISLGFVTAREFAETIADQSGVEYVDLRGFSITDEALRLIPKETARKSGYIPLEVQNGILSIGVTNPSNIVAVDTVRQLTGSSPKVYLVRHAASPGRRPTRRCLRKTSGTARAVKLVSRHNPSPTPPASRRPVGRSPPASARAG